MALRNSLCRIRLIYGAHSRLRGRRQARFARRELAWYRKEATRRGVRVPDTEDDVRTLLAERLAGRSIEPGPPGDLHIFLAYYVSNWEAVLPVSLGKLGEVSEFQWRALGFDHRAEDWLYRRDEMNSAMLAAFHEADSRRKVDVVVGYLSGGNTSPETLREMARSGAVIVNFCWDDKLHFRGPVQGGRLRGPAAICPAVDLNMTNAPESVVKYAVEGGIAAFLPEAAEPDVHKPCDVPFEHDVSFVGGCYGERPLLVKWLRKKGVNVAAFGPGWARERRGGTPAGPLSDEEMVRLYSRSRINLGFAGVGHSRTLTCLKGRDFEVPMSGGLYLTQHNPELALVYEMGSEIVTWRDRGDCLRKIRRLLDNPAEADRIRKAGRERALRDHTWERRFGRAFELCGLMGRDGG